MKQKTMQLNLLILEPISQQPGEISIDSIWAILFTVICIGGLTMLSRTMYKKYNSRTFIYPVYMPVKPAKLIMESNTSKVLYLYHSGALFDKISLVIEGFELYTIIIPRSITREDLFFIIKEQFILHRATVDDVTSAGLRVSDILSSIDQHRQPVFFEESMNEAESHAAEMNRIMLASQYRIFTLEALYVSLGGSRQDLVNEYDLINSGVGIGL